MAQMSGSRLFVLLHVVLLVVPSMVRAEGLQVGSAVAQGGAVEGEWSEPAEHIYGLPEMKAHKKGTLTLGADGLTFVTKAGRMEIARASITAVSVGNERVEMWGMTGRILRMAIPDNGGMAIAAFAHHRIDMLTVEFRDARGGTHSAVFFLGANHAAQAISSFALQAKVPETPVVAHCEGALTEQGAMLILEPDWDGAQVPAVYRGLVYEHLMERFRRAKSVTKVYREGEGIPEGLCPQYTVRLSVTGFKEGSSVKRAMLGPVGMFVGTTQMVFSAELSDRTGKLKIEEQIKTTVRGESESTSVADSVAKSLVKKYEKAVKENEKKERAGSGAVKA
jgi:hypothetical protein